ncbi:MAG TPA: hypothetical protein VHX66_09730 [Solirubrobacteraceae bacterium]|jgi:hypothetical protein|nr:hypothetical protein [Solirubrobacteraceae bacterium]
MDLSRLSREDWTVGAGGLLFAFGLIAFPWSTVTVGGYSLSLAATAGAGGLWADLALIVLSAVIADLALARLSPQTKVPTTQLGRETTRAAALGVMALLMFTRLLAHTGHYGWGFYADVILLVAVASAGWLNAQGHATPSAPRARAWSAPRRASRAGQ